MTPNSEVERPGTSARFEPRAHTPSQRPRRHSRRSRSPPTIVRRRWICRCVLPFQQKRDADSRADKCPDDPRRYIKDPDVREQEHRAGYQQERRRNAAVKSSILRPVRNTADTSGQQTCARRGPPERTPIQTDKAEQRPGNHRCREPVAHRGR
jgi:hypothetical protein